MTFVDFTKAFDYVQRESMFHKLLNLGIKSYLYIEIQNIYTDPVRRVVLNNHRGDWFPVGAGVRQGDCLSPVLVASFINGLSMEIDEVNMGISLLLYLSSLLLLLTSLLTSSSLLLSPLSLSLSSSSSSKSSSSSSSSS